MHTYKMSNLFYIFPDTITIFTFWHSVNITVLSIPLSYFKGFVYLVYGSLAIKNRSIWYSINLASTNMTNL